MDSDRDSKTNEIYESHNIRYTAFVFLIGVLFTVLGLMAFKFITHTEIVSGKTYEYYKSLEDKFGKYYEVDKLIGQHSIYDQDSDKLDEQIMEDVLASVDDHYIEYMTEEQYETFNDAVSGKYTGCGVAVSNYSKSDTRVIVRRVIKDSPCDKAGVKEGDIIVGIDGKEPKDFNDAAKLMAGEAGTDVKLTVLRGDVEIDFDITRADVQDQSVISEIYDKTNGIGYVRILSFTSETGKEFETELKSLAKDGCDKYIVDIRSNGGGVMKQGVKCADLILPACKIMTARDASGKETVYNSDASMIQGKYVLLVNGNTASASEIFAGAVKDNKGATLIGTKTFGKGIIQGIYKLKDNARLKLTIEEYFLPNGEAINNVGVTPDIIDKDENPFPEAIETLLSE